MKRLKLVIVILLILSLSGCMQKYTATDVQSDAVAEYMAGLLLKYDEDYDQELTPLEEMTEDETTFITSTPTPIVPPENAVPDNSSSDDPIATSKYTLAEVIGNTNFEISYKDYSLTDTYPEDTENKYFTLSPREGYQLLAVSFTVKNITDSDKRLNLGEDDLQYRLKLNDNTQYQPILTLLKNDLQFIDITVGSGKTNKALLVFEVTKNVSISKMNLIVTNGEKSNTVEIK